LGSEENKEGIFDKEGNVRFDRRKYDLETFKAILSKVDGFDYRDLIVTERDIEVIKKSFDNMSAT